jgi:hypothetical protein
VDVTLELDVMKNSMIDDHHVVGESVHMSAVRRPVTTTALTARLRLCIN